MNISSDVIINAFSSGETLPDSEKYPEGVRLRLKLSRAAIKYFIQNEDEYIKYCKITLNDSLKIIRDCIEQMRVIKVGELEGLSSRLIVSVFRMVYEKALAMGEWEAGSELPVIEFMLDQEIVHTKNEKLQIPMWTFRLQKDVFALIHNKKMSEIIEISGKIEALDSSYENKHKSWGLLINEWENKLEAYRQSVEKLTQHYNFFGLAKAFKDLIDRKKKDIFWTNWYLRGMAVLVLSPLTASVYLSYLIWADAGAGIDPMKNKLLLSLPVLIPLELILIYFFRIILKEQLSLKAQILQLELRYSVCAFIEEYSKFSKGVEKDKLEKFEALIFSGITPDPTTVPSTFDGIEQLATFMQKFQK